MSTTGPGSEHDDGEQLGDDVPDPQMRCGMQERAVCELETGVNWWLEDDDQYR